MSARAAKVIRFARHDRDDEDLHSQLVQPGVYDAAYVSHKGIRPRPPKFPNAKVRVDFRLLERPLLVLHRWYRVSECRGGRISATKHSDIVREMQAALAKRVRPDRIPVSDLAGKVLRVSVRTVTINRDQKELNSINQYSVIAEILPELAP